MSLSYFGRRADAVASGGSSGLLSSAYNASTTPGWVDLTSSLDFTPIFIGPTVQCPFPYVNSMPWNPILNQIWIIGGDHGTYPPYHIALDNATGTFINYGRSYGSHGFQHSFINPNTGDVYLLIMGPTLDAASGTISGEDGLRYSSEGYGIYKRNEGKYTDWPHSYPTSYDKYFVLPGTNWNNQIAMSTCWWDGAVTGGGAQGAGIIYNGDTSQIHIWNPLNNAVATINTVVPGQVGYYHNLCAFSKIHNCVVYGGGNNSGFDNPGVAKQVWRLNADQSTTQLPDAPFRFGVQNGMNMVADPLSGNILFNGDDQHWKLNPSGSGTWTQLAAPSNDDAVPLNGEVVAFMSSATPYGVFYMQKVAGSSTTQFKAWLYISTPP